MNALTTPRPPWWRPLARIAWDAISGAAQACDHHPERVMGEEYRRRVRKVIYRRVRRMLSLLSDNPPDLIIARELTLIGDLATMVDPHGMAVSDGEANERRARRFIGMCGISGCARSVAADGSKYGDDHCGRHAEEIRIDLEAADREYAAGDTSSAEIKAVS
jgi:hypothetical protein